MCIMSIFGCHSKKSNNPPDSVVMGTKVTLHSNILNEEREIWINIPDSKISSSFTKCPVLYLLDAETYFNPITEKIRKLGTTNNNENLTKLIIVGIPNIDRIRDFTPTNDLEPSKSSFLPITDSLFRTSGGVINLFLLSNMNLYHILIHCINHLLCAFLPDILWVDCWFCIHS